VRQLAHRYVLTENCNANCPHCFNAEARDQGVMDADLYFKFIRKNSMHLSNITALLMGGEPTLHPRIIDIIVESAKHYGTVDVFTNGSRLNKISKHPEIVREHFRDKVVYTVNGYVFDPVKFLEYKDFIKTMYLHFVITTWGYKETIQKIFDCMKFHPQVAYTISCDTQIDVFDDVQVKEYRKIWLESIKQIIPRIKAEGIDYRTDHSLPLCFFTGEMLDELNLIGLHNFQFINTCCACPDIGLIDWNWDLYYCNQTRIKLGSVLDEADEPKSLQDLVNEYITPAYSFKTNCISNLREECKNCKSLNMCRVGCYYNTLVKHCNSKGG
jgi:radical SAM protein with 4Fe4S-binding SPASM domain